MVKNSLKVGCLYRLKDEPGGVAGIKRPPCLSVVSKYKLALSDGSHVDYESASATFFSSGVTVLYLGLAETIEANRANWKAKGIFVHEFLIDSKVYKILSTFSYGNGSGGRGGFERFEDAFELITDPA